MGAGVLVGSLGCDENLMGLPTPLTDPAFGCWDVTTMCRARVCSCVSACSTE